MEISGGGGPFSVFLHPCLRLVLHRILSCKALLLRRTIKLLFFIVTLPRIVTIIVVII